MTSRRHGLCRLQYATGYQMVEVPPVCSFRTLAGHNAVSVRGRRHCTTTPLLETSIHAERGCQLRCRHTSQLLFLWSESAAARYRFPCVPCLVAAPLRKQSPTLDAICGGFDAHLLRFLLLVYRYESACPASQRQQSPFEERNRRTSCHVRLTNVVGVDTPGCLRRTCFLASYSCVDHPPDGSGSVPLTP